MAFTFSPLSEQALVIETGAIINKESELAVRKLSTLLEKEAPKWLIEFIPAFTTVTVFYDPCQLKQAEVEQELKSLMAQMDEVEAPAPRQIEIPVCYGGDFGPDLCFVAEHNGLTEEEVIDIHTSGIYSVHMIGFAPGFPVIGGMSENIAAPRRNSPRVRVPDRLVPIGGSRPHGRSGALSSKRFSSVSVDHQRPSFQPHSSSTPTSRNPRRWCRATDASLGRVTTA